MPNCQTRSPLVCRKAFHVACSNAENRTSKTMKGCIRTAGKVTAMVASFVAR